MVKMTGKTTRNMVVGCFSRRFRIFQICTGITESAANQDGKDGREAN
jgi:hypothetical protein